MFNPLSLLLPYQRRILNAIVNHRLTFVLAARQIGKSFTISTAAVYTAVSKPRSLTIIVSSGERAAKELLDKVKKNAEAWRICFIGSPGEFSYEFNAEEMRFSNGSRIKVLPANNPAVTRGYSPNLLILDEMSVLEHQKELFSALFPSISSPFGGEKRMVIAGTPLGRMNEFWKIWEGDNDFYKISVNIEEAKAEGLNVDIPFLRNNCVDEETFNEEYMCVPRDGDTQLFSIGLINQCVYHDIPREGKRRFMGIDIGRVNDLTCATTIVEVGNNLYCESCDIFRNMEFDEQDRCLTDLIRLKNPVGVAIDSTGIGMQLGESMWKKFGAIVEQFTFTNSTKVDIFNNLKKLMGQARMWIPNDADLKSELASIRRVARENGITYQADRTSKGHADRATSLALGGRAYTVASNSVPFLPMDFPVPTV